MKTNIVFLTAITFPGQEERSAPYKFGIDSWQQWCDKNDCELYVLDQPILPPEYCKPNFYRYWVFDILEENNIEYNQICLTDADSIIHPECPNFFNLTNNEYTVTFTEGSMDWVCRSLENYSELLFKKDFPLHRYFNAGFQVVNKNHRHLFEELKSLYEKERPTIVNIQQTYGVGTDQPLINFIVNLSDTKVKYLHYKYCMADMYRKEILDEDLTFLKVLKGIYQFNAIPNNSDQKKTYYWMEKAYNYLYK